MSASRGSADQILAHLHRVEQERHQRAHEPTLGARVRDVKSYQHRRFARSHAALLENPRYREASTFFLEHLYGPEDFSNRDEQFARVVPAMVKLFPAEVVDTVAALAELHAISEHLDTRMATHVGEVAPLDRPAYVRAWQATGEANLRRRQIDLSVDIGKRLDRLTRNPLIRHSLRMMRGPAKAAGLSELQKFLEAGFEAFRAMRGANEFLARIDQQERRLADELDTATPPFQSATLIEMLP